MRENEFAERVADILRRHDDGEIVERVYDRFDEKEGKTLRPIKKKELVKLSPAGVVQLVTELAEKFRMSQTVRKRLQEEVVRSAKPTAEEFVDRLDGIVAGWRAGQLIANDVVEMTWILATEFDLVRNAHDELDADEDEDLGFD